MDKEESKYYEFIYFQVRPKHLRQFSTGFKTKVEFFEKHGAKVFGQYTCVIGAVGEYLLILEYDTLHQKLIDMESLMADQDYLDFNDGFTQLVSKISTYVTTGSEFTMITAPNPNSYLFLRRVDVKSNPFDAVLSYHKSQKWSEEIFRHYIKSMGFITVGYFVPIYGANCGSFFALYDMGAAPASLEAPTNYLKTVSTDPSHKEVSASFEFALRSSAKIYATSS